MVAGPGLRGGLLGHAAPGGELAGAEAAAGGGEVGRDPHPGAMAMGGIWRDGIGVGWMMLDGGWMMLVSTAISY